MTRFRAELPTSSVQQRYHIRQTWGRLLKSLIPVGGILLFGSIGYTVLEGWPLLNSLYMTLITLSTIGYGLPHPLSPAGQVFTLVLIVLSLGIAGYALSTLAAFIFEGELNRMIEGSRMDQRIGKLNQHIILCGCGSTGRYIAEEFNRTGTPFVIIDNHMEHIEETVDATSENLHFVLGDATRDDTLRKAGIERAHGLITALNDDQNNLFVVLSARTLNPLLRIVARVVDEENHEKLLRAGADEVISPNMIGGLRMASVMLRPTVVAFLDEMLRMPDVALRMEEIKVSEVPGLRDKTLGETHIGQRTGMLVVAIASKNETYQFNPGANTVLLDGDVLIVIGTAEQREQLHQLAGEASK